MILKPSARNIYLPSTILFEGIVVYISHCNISILSMGSHGGYIFSFGTKKRYALPTHYLQLYSLHHYELYGYACLLVEEDFLILNFA